jgi:phosphomethylpyrimidine synthase
MTELELARRGTVTDLVTTLAREESLDPQALRAEIAAGRAVAVSGPGRRPLLVGGGATVKVNANVGTSTDAADLGLEAEKVRIAASLGARMISDCSVGGDLDVARRALVDAADLPVVTVPMYQAAAEAGSAAAVTPAGFLGVLERQLREGASGVVIHAALDAPLLALLRGRVMGLVSRGGQLTARWMEAAGRATPFEGFFDDALDLLHAHDAVLVVGNAARAGCVHDRLDDGHRREADLGESLSRRANDAGVQVIVEAVGGHVHVADVAAHVETYKRVGSRPLFAAGPLTIDAAMGHDHLSAIIGGALAAGAGCDLLCYITPAEHLGLPTLEDVREGTIGCVVAAYHGDAARRGPLPRDLLLAQARRRFDWSGQFRHALHPERAMARHRPGEGCSMCGEFCPMREPPR